MFICTQGYHVHIPMGIEPHYDLKCAYPLIPMQYDSLWKFLSRHKSRFPARYRRTSGHRRIRLLLASEIRTIRSMVVDRRERGTCLRLREGDGLCHFTEGIPPCQRGPARVGTRTGRVWSRRRGAPFVPVWSCPGFVDRFVKPASGLQAFCKGWSWQSVIPDSS